MTIDKAIEILTQDKTCGFEGDAKDLEAALQLGIEALKRFKAYRHLIMPPGSGLLPGETL